MSYILDALKKADAERARDVAAVPDLYAQADAARGARAAARPAGWRLLGLGSAGIVLAVLAWQWWRSAPVADAPPTPIAQAPAAAPLPAVPAPAPVPVPAPAPVVAAPVLAGPTASPPPPSPSPPTTLAPAVAAPAAPPRPLVMAAPAPLATPARERAPAKPAPAASAGAEARLPSLAELTPDLRSRLPALVVGGSVYSPNPASRMVILNGQVFREGDKPVEGLSIEQIRLKSTVLAFRGQRFELKH